MLSLSIKLFSNDVLLGIGFSVVQGLQLMVRMALGEFRAINEISVQLKIKILKYYL